MAAIILTWNPQRWNNWDYDALVDRVSRGETVKDTWSVSHHTHVPQGADAYLLLQGKRRGLVGHAVVTSREPYLGGHFSEPGESTHYVRLTWDALLPLDDRVPPSDLEAAAPGVYWKWLPASGRSVPPQDEHALADLWADAAGHSDHRAPDEFPAGAPEGGARRVEVNRYERSQANRQACFDRWGRVCAACGLDPVTLYGPDLGPHVIVAHHVTPVSQLGPGYRIDPVKEMRPLCPNCHAAVHTSDPPLKPSTLKRRLSR